MSPLEQIRVGSRAYGKKVQLSGMKGNHTVEHGSGKMDPPRDARLRLL